MNAPDGRAGCLRSLREEVVVVGVEPPATCRVAVQGAVSGRGVGTTTVTLNVNGRQISGVCRAEFDPDTGVMGVIFVGDENPENPMGDRAMRWMARFGSLLDALGEGVAMVDSAGTVRYSNIHMNELTGDDQMIIDLSDKVLQSGATEEVLGGQKLRVPAAAGRHHPI